MTIADAHRGVENRTGFIFMGCFFCPMTVCVVLSRFYARRLTKAGLGADDWLALVAMVFVLGLNGIFISGTVQGAITGHSPFDSENKSISTELEHTAQKYKYAFQITEKLAFGLIKLSIIFLWKRLFGLARYITEICWIMVFVTSGWALSFFFATIFECGTNWELNWAPVTIFLDQCAHPSIILSVFTGMDLFTDIIIMFMPVPLIWGLHIDIKKKISITSMFVLGLFTIVAGAIRMYFYIITSYYMDENPDFLANFTLFILWSDIEANVAMVVCCMPTLAPALRSYYNSLATFLGRVRSDQRFFPSSSHSAKRPSNVDPKPPIASEIELLPFRKGTQDGAFWQDVPRVVTEASYGEVEAQTIQNNEGILARTEIYRTSECRERYI